MNLFGSIVIIYLTLQFCTGFEFSDILNFFHKFDGSMKKRSSEINEFNNSSKNLCDENKLMLNLASMGITSPERILLFVTSTKTPYEVCEKLEHFINTTKIDQMNCVLMDGSNNLYQMLLNGIKALYSDYCRNEDFYKKFNKHTICYQELNEEFIDCEGPADWFENSNKTNSCSILNEVLECGFIKTAEICGNDAANLFKCLSSYVIQKSMKFNCSKDFPNEFQKITNGAELNNKKMIFYWIVSFGIYKIFIV